MLSPARTKYRKQMKRVRHLRGNETRGTDLAFGEYGLKSTEGAWVNARQIEAARVAMTRFVKRGGKVWIRIFPDKPLTSKPAETRMGSGKGAPEEWVAEIRSGRILFEMTGVTEAVARDAFQRASSKLPVRTKFVLRSGNLL